MKIHTGDTVVVISGKDKGKTGQVMRVLEEKNRVVISDINMRTRHMRATPQRPGEIVRYEASIHLSNVMLVDPKTKKRTRVGFTTDAKGNKVRTAKRSGETISRAAKAKTTKPKTEETKKSETATTKETSKKTTEKKAEGRKTDAPNKQPFWKRMGFGAQVLEGSEVEQGSHMQQDHSVPAQEQRQSNRSHSRGS